MNSSHSDNAKVLVVQHVACETLGTIEPALRAQQLSPQFVRVDLGEPVPTRCDDACGLIIMGGPMSVNDAPQRPHLSKEMALIESALSAQRAVLGVCLGSQLLAHVLGSRIVPGTQKEIGWHPVLLSEVGRQDPLWAGAPSEFQGFHWHGDIFDPPPGSESLASSRLTACQAFRHGTSAYGVLFHMEVTAPLIEGMAENFPEELAEAGGDRQQLQRGTEAHLAALNSVGEQFFSRWAALAARSREPET